MGIYLPGYMAHERRYICTHCGFKYRRVSPSQVDKCPQCERIGRVSIAYERGVDPNHLDPYSETKRRWYSDPEGRSHVESIKNRVIKQVEGKQVVIETDKKGRKIEELPIPAIPKEVKTPVLKE